MRWRKITIWVGLCILLFAAIAVLNGLRGRVGWTAIQQMPDELARQIVPSFQWTVPPGEGPFPAAVLLSGCDGVKSNLSNMAEALAGHGWLSVIVDSHGPRGLDQTNLWRLVCAGQLLNGAERAADVAIALNEVMQRGDVDRSRVALIGFSHGGWSVLDFLALSAQGQVSPLLTEWPKAISGSPHELISASVFFYPYCGPAARSSVDPLPARPAYLFLLVAGDAIVGEQHCFEIAGRLLAVDAEVTVRVFSGVTHSFDQEEKSGGTFLEFDAEATEKATGVTLEFLSGLPRN
jgi:dienelactone hydrolase